MNIEELKESGWLIFEYVRGSHLYGTATPESDVDIGGIFMAPKSKWLSMIRPPNEISDAKGDTTYYELRRYLELASACNPSIIEAMYVPEDCSRHFTATMDVLENYRHIFMTKKAEHSFCGYAFQQIKKASGQNKKVNSVDRMVDNNGIEYLRHEISEGNLNPKEVQRRTNENFLKYVMKDVKSYPGMNLPMAYSNLLAEEIFNNPAVSCMLRPERRDYFWFIPANLAEYAISNSNARMLDENVVFISKLMPFRPVKFVPDGKYDISAVEHINGLYRLYSNGSGIRFDNDEPACTSISMEREWKDYVGVIYYNDDGYKKDCAEYISFWEWMGNRNEARWNTDWQKNAKYDTKNMMHTVRLLLSAESIATKGEPIVRFEGEQLAFLKKIRAGEFAYDWILSYARDKEAQLKELFAKSTLPWGCDMKEVDSLYQMMLRT